MRCSIALVALLAACTDKILVLDVPEGTECGILVDGQGDEPWRDVPMRGENPVFDVKLDKRTDHDSVVAFASGRAPVLAQAHWTPDSDVLFVCCPPPAVLTVAFWILWDDGDLEGTEKDLDDAVEDANALFTAERVGILLQRKEFHDVTGIAEVASFLDFNLVVSKDAHENVGCDPVHLNIYITKTVLGADGGGMWDETTPDIIAMARGFSKYLLAHEVGHALDLHHPDDGPFEPGFDETNLMAKNAPTTRYYVSEGQNFRARFSVNSHLYLSWGLQDEAAYIKRWDAGENATFGDYPPARWRIWADGPQPATALEQDETEADSSASVALPPPAILAASFPDARSLPASESAAATFRRDPPPLRAEAYCVLDCPIVEGHVETFPPPDPADERAFLSALADGPPERLLQRTTEAAERGLAARAAFLGGPLAEGTLPPESLAKVRTRTRAEEPAKSRRRLDIAYRSRAIDALVILRSRAALPELRRIAADPDSPLQAKAREAIEAISH